MNNNKFFEPIEVLAPLSYAQIDEQAPVSVECNTGYTCKVGKATY